MSQSQLHSWFSYKQLGKYFRSLQLLPLLFFLQSLSNKKFHVFSKTIWVYTDASVVIIPPCFWGGLREKVLESK